MDILKKKMEINTWFNSDDDLPLNKPLKFHAIGYIEEKNGNKYLIFDDLLMKTKVY